MKKRLNVLGLLLVFMLLFSACGGGNDNGMTEGGRNSDAEIADPLEGAEAPADSDAPAAVAEAQAAFGMVMPSENVTNPTFDGTSLNMAVGEDFDTLVEFMRNSAGAAGYTEYELLTSITDGVASMVFNGHAGGQSIVIQMVDLGNGTVNINVRFEDL